MAGIAARPRCTRAPGAAGEARGAPRQGRMCAQRPRRRLRPGPGAGTRGATGSAVPC